jgi:hypothetical protein
MALMWPTCLRTMMFSLSPIQIEFPRFDSILKNNTYPPINDYYTNHGYPSREFLFNVLDVLLFLGVFVVLIPVWMVAARFIKQ